MNVFASVAFIMGPADFTAVVNVAGRFANGVFPELVKGRVAPVGVAGLLLHVPLRNFPTLLLIAS